MEKSPLTYPEKVVKDPKIHDKIKKTRKDKTETSCQDKRRQYGHCGLCGSEDLVYEGIKFCKSCENEEYFIDSGEYWLWWTNPAIPKLPCEEEHDIRMSMIVITHCLTCGATNGPKCPNCNKRLWGNGLKKHCLSCGFRNNG